MDKSIDLLYEDILKHIPKLKSLVMEDFYSVYNNDLKITVYVQILNDELFSLRIEATNSTIHFRGSFEDVKFLLRGKIREASNNSSPKTFGGDPEAILVPTGIDFVPINITIGDSK